MKRNTIATAAALMLAAALMFGCSTEQLDKAKATVQETRAVYTAATQATTQMSAEIAKLPADDPVRKATEAKIADLNAKAASLEKYIATAEAAIQAAQTGELDQLRDAAKDVPYGSLAVGVLGIIIGAWKTYQASKAANAARQLATALDAVTPGETLANPSVAAALDESTKAIAGAVIGALPDAPLNK